MAVTIYHNPQCSNSRAALEFLRAHGIEPRVVLYLKNPPDRATLADILRRLDAPPMALIRTKEREFADAGLTPDSPAKAVMTALLACPRLLQRPLVDLGERVIIARPPDILSNLL